MDSSKDAALELQKCDVNALVKPPLQRASGRLSHARSRLPDLSHTVPSLMLDAKKVAAVLDAVMLNALEAMSERGGDLIRSHEDGELTVGRNRA